MALLDIENVVDYDFEAKVGSDGKVEKSLVVYTDLALDPLTAEANGGGLDELVDNLTTYLKGKGQSFSLIIRTAELVDFDEDDFEDEDDDDDDLEDKER